MPGQGGYSFVSSAKGVPILMTRAGPPLSQWVRPRPSRHRCSPNINRRLHQRCGVKEEEQDQDAERKAERAAIDGAVAAALEPVDVLGFYEDNESWPFGGGGGRATTGVFDDYDYQPSASLPADGRRGDPGAPGKDTGRRRIHGGSRSNSNKRQRGFSSSEKGAQIRAVIQAIKDVSAAGLSEDVPAMVEDARRAGVPIDARVHSASVHAALGGGSIPAALDAIAAMRADGFVPNISLYNKAISACGRRGIWQESVRMLRDAREAGREVDVVTYSAAVAACRNGGAWPQALALLEEMTNEGIEPDRIAFGTAVSACAMGGLWQQARSLLEDMRNANVRPDVIAYSSAIQACKQDGCWEEALDVLKEMKGEGVRPNLITYTGAVETCGRAGQWKKALWLLSKVRDDGLLPDTRILTAVIDALARAGETEKALALLQTMRPPRPPSTKRITSTSTSSANSPSTSAARSNASGTTTRTYSLAASGGAPHGRSGKGGETHQRSPFPLPPLAAAAAHPRADVYSWSAAMTACIEGGQCEKPAEMLEEMREDGLQPNVINYNLVVRALGRAGKWDQAVALLDDMREKGVEPDHRTFNAAIEACGLRGCWERAVSLMDDMRHYGITPDELTYSAVISACDRGGAWDMALMMLDEARETRFGHDPAATESDVLNFVDVGRIGGVDNDNQVVASWSSEGGERIGAKSFAYSAAISACGKAGQWEKAVSLLDVMRHDGVAPNGVTLRSALRALENAPHASPPDQDIFYDRAHIPPYPSDAHPSDGGVSFASSMYTGGLEEAVNNSWFDGENDGRRSSSQAAVEDLEDSLNFDRYCVDPMGDESVDGIDRGVDENPPFIVAGSSAVLDEGEDGVPWDISFRLLQGMARGEELESPGPLDFAAGLTTACCGGAGWPSVLKVLDLMHRCADNPDSPGHDKNYSTEAGVTPNVATYSGVIIACDLAGLWEQALAYLDKMQDRADVARLLDIRKRGFLPQEEECLFLKPDLVCYNCAVKACGSSGQWEQALRIMESMRAVGIHPDEVTYSSAISACGNAGRPERALSLLWEMKTRGIPAELIAHNAALGACDKAGEWKSAMAVMREMRDEGIKPDAISYAAAISACDKAGEWQLTLGLFDQMSTDLAIGSPAVDERGGGGEREIGVDRDSSSSGFGRLGEGEVPPPRLTVAALTACARGGEWRKAMDILHSTRAASDNGNWEHLGQLSSFAFNAALVACAKGAKAEAKEGSGDGWREALEVLQMMDVPPNRTNYGCAITACGYAGEVDACLNLLRDMIRGGATPTLGDYHNSLRACTATARGDAVLEILESMSSTGVEAKSHIYSMAAQVLQETSKSIVASSSEGSAPWREHANRLWQLARDSEERTLERGITAHGDPDDREGDGWDRIDVGGGSNLEAVGFEAAENAE